MKIMKTTENHPKYRFEDIRRNDTTMEALFQHPQRLVERFKDHAGMVTVRPKQVE